MVVLYVVFIYLRSAGRRRLEVVRLQVALEIEDLELIRLRERQKLAERRIRLDDLLDHERLLLRIAADTRGDLRAGEKSALGDAEERAERIRDGRWLREDRLLLRRGGVGVRCGLACAAALGGALQLTRDLLLELLHVGEDRAERGAERVDLLNELVELCNDVDILRRRCGGSSLNVRNGVDVGGDRGDDGGRGGDGGGGDGDGGGGGGGDSGSSLLGGALGRSCGGGHLFYVGGRGSFIRIQTRECLSAVQFLYSSILAAGIIENAAFFALRSFISMGFPRDFILK